MLELGVRDGNSTVALLAGLERRGGTLWSVDVEPASAGIFAGHEQWRFVLADSRDEPVVADAGLPGELDVLFVDTIHTYEQVRDELAVWGDRVGPGGVILFHDTDSFPEIRAAISEWCAPRGIPLEFLGRSNGLGVAYPGRGAAFGVWLRVRRAPGQLALDVQQGCSWAVRLPRRVLRRTRRTLSGRRVGSPLRSRRPPTPRA